MQQRKNKAVDDRKKERRDILFSCANRSSPPCRRNIQRISDGNMLSMSSKTLFSPAMAQMKV